MQKKRPCVLDSEINLLIRKLKRVKATPGIYNFVTVSDLFQQVFLIKVKGTGNSQYRQQASGVTASNGYVWGKTLKDLWEVSKQRSSQHLYDREWWSNMTWIDRGLNLLEWWVGIPRGRRRRRMVRWFGRKVHVRKEGNGKQSKKINGCQKVEVKKLFEGKGCASRKPTPTTLKGNLSLILNSTSASDSKRQQATGCSAQKCFAERNRTKRTDLEDQNVGNGEGVRCKW